MVFICTVLYRSWCIGQCCAQHCLLDQIELVTKPSTAADQWQSRFVSYGMQGTGIMIIIILIKLVKISGSFALHAVCWTKFWAIMFILVPVRHDVSSSASHTCCHMACEQAEWCFQLSMNGLLLDCVIGCQHVLRVGWDGKRTERCTYRRVRIKRLCYW